jgi:hypothetical protein
MMTLLLRHTALQTSQFSTACAAIGAPSCSSSAFFSACYTNHSAMQNYENDALLLVALADVVVVASSASVTRKSTGKHIQISGVWKQDVPAHAMATYNVKA